MIRPLIIAVIITTDKTCVAYFFVGHHLLFLRLIGCFEIKVNLLQLTNRLFELSIITDKLIDIITVIIVRDNDLMIIDSSDNSLVNFDLS